jgi:integrase
MKLSNTTITALQLPEGVSDKVFFDDKLPGYGVRVRAGGSKTYHVQYDLPGGRTRKMAGGSVTVMKEPQAREWAQKILARVKLGEDPASGKAEKRADSRLTVGKLIAIYLEGPEGREPMEDEQPGGKRRELKPRSFLEVERHLRRHAAPLHATPVIKVDRRAIAGLLATIESKSGPVARNRTRASLSGFFTWAAKEGYIDANPVTFTNTVDENDPRARTPSDDELRIIWRALDDDHYGAILKLLLLTGARRDEIGGLRWSEIDPDQALITLPPERTKIRKEHLIPLSKPALAILQAQLRRTNPDGTPRDHVFGKGLRGFQDWSGSKADLDTGITKANAGKEFEPWSPHDFRRSLSTALHERFRVPPHVVEVILGHIGGHKAGVAGVYNKALYLDERRRALERWGAHIVGLATGKLDKAKVVDLRGRRR